MLCCITIVPVLVGRSTHNKLIQKFQRLVELCESGSVMAEASAHAARRTIPDMKPLLASWRQRLPESFKPVSEWNDIFLWHSQVFDALQAQFLSTNDPIMISTLHDRPFMCISLEERQGSRA